MVLHCFRISFHVGPNVPLTTNQLWLTAITLNDIMIS